MSNSIFYIHLISDSTGETVKGLSKACIALFPDTQIEEQNYAFVRTENRIEEILDKAVHKKGFILFTFANKALTKFLNEGCEKRNLKAISILDPLLQFFSQELGVEPIHKAGLQHMMGEEYFKRIEAIDFSLYHDDGKNIETFDQADVVLIGVSRTSKTPTCIYLANKGIKAANIPFVTDWAFYEKIIPMMRKEKPVFFGLIQDIYRLVEIRKNRISSLEYQSASYYVDPEKINDEVILAKRFCGKYGIKIIDVTRRSIEETASEIMSLMKKA